jgi:signal transduction histidine kinase
MSLYLLPPFLSLCGFIALGYVAGFKAPKTAANRFLLILCAMGALLFIDILVCFSVPSAITALWISRFDHLFLVFSPAVYVLFFHSILGISKRGRLEKALLIYSALLTPLIPTSLFISRSVRHPFGFFGRAGPLYPLFGLFSIGVSVYILVLIFNAIRKEPRSIEKNRLKYIFLGFGGLGVLNCLNFFPLIEYPVYPPGNFSFLCLILFGIGIYRYDLLAMGQMIQRGAVYTLLTALLIGLYALGVFVVGQASKRYGISNGFLFQFLFFFLIALALNPLKAQIQSLLSKFFFKEKQADRRAIKELSITVAGLRNLSAVAAAIKNAAQKALGADHGETFLPVLDKHENIAGWCRVDGTGSSDIRIPALSAYLSQVRLPAIRSRLIQNRAVADNETVVSDMNSLNAELVLPLIFENRINGMVVLGQRVDGELFSANDLDLLETLAGQSAVAIENALSYQKLSEFSEALEVKVKQRTKELESALIEKDQTMERLLRAESLAAVGRLAAGVAHELNNPLASAKSLVQSTIEELVDMQQNGALNKDIIQELVGDLRFSDRELGRAKEIVSSLLGLSRQTQTYTEIVDLNVVSKDALRVLNNFSKRLPVSIVEAYEEPGPRILGNFAHLGQVTMNLIKNALQALSGSGGTLHVRTRTVRVGGFAEFECEDDGPGISEEIRRHIFDPFFTTKPVGEGTGLGLYICNEIVSRHGGSIEVFPGSGFSSEPASLEGTRFVVRLPLVAP